MPKITHVILYVHDLDKVARFYVSHFGFQRRESGAPDKVILSASQGGCSLVLLKAARSQKAGQSLVKLVFDVPDVATARAAFLRRGVRFGAIHEGPGYCFSNARDPAKNLIQISDAYSREDASHA